MEIKFSRKNFLFNLSATPYSLIQWKSLAKITMNILIYQKITSRNMNTKFSHYGRTENYEYSHSINHMLYIFPYKRTLNSTKKERKKFSFSWLSITMKRNQCTKINWIPFISRIIWIAHSIWKHKSDQVGWK